MSNENKPQSGNTNSSASANDEALNALLALLNEETLQYESLVTKLREKQDILIAGKPKLLGRVDQELMIIGRKASQLEQKRLTLMSELGQSEQTLSQLISTLEPKAASALNACRQRLARAATDAQQQNRDTQDLLNLSLQWIQDTVELIASALTPEAASYTGQGAKVGQKNNGAAPHPMQSTINHSA